MSADAIVAIGAIAIKEQMVFDLGMCEFMSGIQVTLNG